MFKKIFILSFLAFLVVPAIASAAALSPYWGPLVSCTGAPGTVPVASNNNQPLPQCQSFCDLLHTGQNFVRFGMTIALYIAAPLIFIFGGIKILTARGDVGAVKTARKIMWDTVMGIAVVLCAYLIVNTFFWAMGIVFKGPSGTVSQSSWSEIKCDVQAATPATQASSCGGTTVGSCPAGQNCVDVGGSYQCKGASACGGTTFGSCASGKSCVLLSGVYQCITAN